MKETPSPTVTIGIPVYNEEKYIAETIQSALNQSYSNIRIIISDNCSTDDSFTIIRNFANKDKRIEIARLKKNEGPYNNFSNLLNLAKSEYFMWLGGHDIIAPNFIENALNLFHNNDNIVCVYPLSSHIINGIFETDIISDEIDTEFISLNERLIKICKGVNYGNAVYGLYKKNILEKATMNLNGGDLLIVFISSLYGSYKKLNKISYFFRIIRKIEKSEDIKLRYKSYGFADNWEFQRIALPYEYLIKLSKASFKEKISIMISLKQPLQRFYSFSWLKLLKHFMNKKNTKLIVYINIILILTFLKKIKRCFIKL